MVNSAPAKGAAAELKHRAQPKESILTPVERTVIVTSASREMRQPVVPIDTSSDGIKRGPRTWGSGGLGGRSRRACSRSSVDAWRPKPAGPTTPTESRSDERKRAQVQRRPERVDELMHRVDERLAPRLVEMPGFVAYQVFDAGVDRAGEGTVFAGHATAVIERRPTDPPRSPVEFVRDKLGDMEVEAVSEAATGAVSVNRAVSEVLVDGSRLATRLDRACGTRSQARHPKNDPPRSMSPPSPCLPTSRSVAHRGSADTALREKRAPGRKSAAFHGGLKPPPHHPRESATR